MNNPNCDGTGPHRLGEVRRMSTGGHGAVILCRTCYHVEIRWRILRNQELGPQNRFPLPAWEELSVYPYPQNP